MANSLIVRGRTEPERSTGRAAQYVRASTDYQRYSTENQAATIAAYAEQHNLTIVRTYTDEGRGGLRIANRTGLVDLINDVRFGRTDFDHVLVYDVSRWGRFQDTDESAHYEFMCKQAGIKIAYCAEQFDNDGSLMSSIVKNLKRVMAAEYSRELSVKVHTGACRVASLGFRSGSSPCYGLRRELVDENKRSKGILEKGQRKHLQTDHVLLRPGPKHELEIVKRIFRQFVIDGKSQAEIARQLNVDEVPNHRGKPWTEWIIHYLLQNENYIGNILYNRKSFRLRQVMRSNPPERWVRSRGVFEPIVEVALFSKAQRIMKEHYIRWSDEELLGRLKEALKREGRLSGTIMDRIDVLPSTSLYALRFGSLRNAFKLIGYRSRRNCQYIDSRPSLTAKLLEEASDIARRIRALGAPAAVDSATHIMTIDGRLIVSLRVARYYSDRRKAAIWHVTRRLSLPPGLILALRLDKRNTDILDYFLLPTTEMKMRRRIALTETNRSRFARYRIASVEGVVRSIMEEVAAANQASLATPGPKRTPKVNQPKRKTGRARR
jgi:DNA invertase Pin-like site-specific DNA recombinase